MLINDFSGEQVIIVQPRRIDGHDGEVSGPRDVRKCAQARMHGDDQGRSQTRLLTAHLLARTNHSRTEQLAAERTCSRTAGETGL